MSPCLLSTTLLIVIFTANIHPLEAIIFIRIAEIADAIMPSKRRNVLANIIGPNYRHPGTLTGYLEIVTKEAFVYFIQGSRQRKLIWKVKNAVFSSQ